MLRLLFVFSVFLMLCSSFEGCSPSNICNKGVSSLTLNPNGSSCKTHCDCNNQRYEGYCLEGACKALPREKCDTKGREDPCLPQTLFQSEPGSCTTGRKVCQDAGLKDLYWGNCTCPAGLGDGGNSTESLPDGSPSEPTKPDGNFSIKSCHFNNQCSEEKKESCLKVDKVAFCLVPCEFQKQKCESGSECLINPFDINTSYCAPVGPKQTKEACHRFPTESGSILDVSQLCAKNLACMLHESATQSNALGICVRWHQTQGNPCGGANDPCQKDGFLCVPHPSNGGVMCASPCNDDKDCSAGMACIKLFNDSSSKSCFPKQP